MFFGRHQIEHTNGGLLSAVGVLGGFVAPFGGSGSRLLV